MKIVIPTDIRVLLAVALTLPWFIACGEALTSGSNTAEYAAVLLPPGSFDRMVITKTNYTNNTCWRIGLVAPANALYSINAPTQWEVTSIDQSNDATDCLDRTMPQQGEHASASGDITWENQKTCAYPSELNIEVVVTLDEKPRASLQMTETFSAQNVVVEGTEFFIVCP